MNFSSTSTPSSPLFVRINPPVWIGSILAALGINLLFFLLLPYLLHQTDPPPSLEPLGTQVNVIRIKRPETEVKRKQEPPPKPKETPPPKPTPCAPKPQKLALPFDINPRLPSGPNTMPVPDIQLSSAGRPDLGQPFSAAQLDTPLRAVVRIPPIYPMGAKRRGVEGWVKVRFIVNTQGLVENIQIIEARPDGVFEQSVKRCVSAWKFSPGTIEGMPVRAWVETVVRFKLE